jgi:hypothetical protein
MAGRRATLKPEDGAVITDKINLYTELATHHGSFDKFSEDLGPSIKGGANYSPKEGSHLSWF